MILVHRLDGAPFYLNAELVETVEATPDTVIVLVNGHRYIVKEQVEEVIARILTYRRFLFSGIPVDLTQSMLRER
jgi:flagellar protein FlbD